MQTHGGSRQGDKQGENDWWYWPAADEAPTANRLACGWSSGARQPLRRVRPGLPDGLRHGPLRPDLRRRGPHRALLRSQMLTFPAQDGVMDTLRWEAAREGVVDVRYLTTCTTTCASARTPRSPSR